MFSFIIIIIFWPLAMQHIVWLELFPSVQLWTGCDDLKHEHGVLLSTSENTAVDSGLMPSIVVIDFGLFGHNFYELESV